MRLLLFFDLPVETSKQRKEYRLFRKFLIKNGYIMQQLSVYSKLQMNNFEHQSDIKALKQNKPSAGTIQVLRITEKQFSSMEYILGQDLSSLYETSTKDMVII